MLEDQSNASANAVRACTIPAGTKSGGDCHRAGVRGAFVAAVLNGGVVAPRVTPQAPSPPSHTP